MGTVVSVTGNRANRGSAAADLETSGQTGGGGPVTESQVTNLTSDLATKAQALVPTAVKTGAYTAAAGDLVPVDTTSAAVTVTLPSAPADKTRVAVKHVIQGGTNAVTIAAGGSDVFNKAGGSTSLTLTLLNQSVSLQYKATGGIWYVVADDEPLSALDARFLRAANSLSELSGTASTARTNLGLGSAATHASTDFDAAGSAAAAQAASSQALVPTAVKTSAYTAQPGDLVPVDTTGGTVPITLPNAPADKTRVGVKHVIQGDANAATVSCAGSDVFNKAGGSTSINLALVNQAISLQYAATPKIWYVVADDTPLSQLDARYLTPSAASGTYAALAPAWVTGRAYVLHELVTSSGVLYECTTGHTSGGSFDASKFTAISSGTGSAALTDKGTWTTGTVYAVGDVVTNSNQRYVCKTANTAGATFAGDTAKWVSLDPGAAVPLAQAGQTPAQEPVLPDATASVGSLAEAARADHVHPIPTSLHWMFGYGSTNVVFDGSSTVSGFTRSGSVYTETGGSGVGPKHYRDLTVNSGVTVVLVNVWHVSRTATINGTLSVAGQDAVGATAGAAGFGATAGAAGGTGAGAAGVSFTTGVNRNRTCQYGGVGGAANSGGTAGGNGGGSGNPWDTSYGYMSQPFVLWTGNSTAIGGGGIIGPGNGGGAGAGDGSNAGGGGGGGGGMLILNARTLTGTGILDASGGNGGNAAGGNAGGGGAGGSGYVVVNTSNMTGWAGTIYAALTLGSGAAPTKGLGGTGSGTGANGGLPGVIGGGDKKFLQVWP
jgi:hypothetical protein